MGCATSSEQDGRRGAYAVNDSATQDERQRKMMRKASAGGASDGGLSSRTSKFIESSTKGSGRETLPNSDKAASNAVVGKARSGRFSQSPQCSAGAGSPRVPPPVFGRPPLAPPQIQRPERRVSIGRFADVPTEDDMLKRIATAVEKAKVMHGIDGTVEDFSQKEQRAAAKLGLATLGSHGIRSIQNWCDQVLREAAAARDVMEMSSNTKAPEVFSTYDGSDGVPSPKHQQQVLLPGQPTDDFDNECYMTLSPQTAVLRTGTGTVAAPILRADSFGAGSKQKSGMRLTEEALKFLSRKNDNLDSTCSSETNN